MSDFEYGFEDAPAEDVVVISAEEEMEWEPETISVNMWNGFQGAWQLALLGFGYKAYDWYEGWAYETLPEREDYPNAIYQWDSTHAMETNEFRAWKWVSDIMLVSNSVHWTFWLLNYLFDNEGGDLHRVYHSLNCVSRWYPLLLALLGANVYANYYPSMTIEDHYDDNYSGDVYSVGDDAAWMEAYFFRRFKEITNAPYYYEVKETSHQIYLALTVMAATLFNVYALPGLIQDYDEKRPLFLAAQAEEEMEHEDEAAADADAAEEEPAFF